MNDRAFIALLSVVPKTTLSRVVGAATRIRAPRALHTAAIRRFVRRYGVATEEAELPVEAYQSFGDFFTRRLRSGIRSVAPGDDVAVSPVDGTVYVAGIAEAGRLLQAKGVEYELEALVGDADSARPFVGGAYITLYLSPKDYHRIHSPLGGQIRGYAYIPGKLWPVNPAAVRTVHRLFSQNERLITFLETPVGACAVVKVGATCVGRIRAAYDDVLTNRGGEARRHNYASPLRIAKGDELGAFEMGSTVIVLFERDRVKLEALSEGRKVRWGEAIARGAR
jgi:phosphatidylserine decarboxylase